MNYLYYRCNCFVYKGHYVTIYIYFDLFQGDQKIFAERPDCKLWSQSKSPSELLFMRDKYVQRAFTVHILNFSKIIANYLLIFYQGIA